MGCEVQEGGHTCGVGLVAELCPTLVTPWTVACQAPLSMGFSRQEYWSGLPFPSLGDLSDPGVEPGLLHCRQTLGKPKIENKHVYIYVFIYIYTHTHIAD